MLFTLVDDSIFHHYRLILSEILAGIARTHHTRQDEKEEKQFYIDPCIDIPFNFMNMMSELITLSKEKVKYCQNLQSAKARQKYDKFVIEGDKISLEFIQQKPLDIEFLVCRDDWYRKNYHAIKYLGITCYRCDEKDFKQISTHKTPQGVLLVAKRMSLTKLKDLSADAWYLYLDRIQDPGNMGTILRVAEWFGIEAVVLPKGSVDVFNPKVIQSSMGSIWRVPRVCVTFDEFCTEFPDIPKISSSLNGTVGLEILPKMSSGIIVIGNESKGVSREIQGKSDILLTIYSAPTNQAESLNAAMATGIICSYIKK